VLALGAAEAIGADLVGVDLLPDGESGWVVVELNGAADFTRAYDLGGRDVFARAVRTVARYARSDAKEEEQKAPLRACAGT
jgi:glutathione synthase/RimK-type ligase-like ATP-grasp enzyme